MTGTVLLQGGGEFSVACRPMDAALLRQVGGPVVVTALAGAPGREYDTANRNGVAHYLAVGASDVTGAPDVRTDPDGALTALRRARLLVLPGGSPARLLAVLTGTAAGEVVAALLAGGGGVMGSSAGAMVLGGWSVLPEHGATVRRGLCAVPQVLVVPHWVGPRADWLRAVDEGTPADAVVLGLPEESGVLVRDREVEAVGAAPTRLVRAGRDLAPGERLTMEER